MFERDKDALLEELEQDIITAPSSIDEQLKAEDLYDRRLQRKMRVSVESRAFMILYAELSVLGIVVFLQGFKLGGFFLNDWVFGIISSGCLLQTFGIIRAITINLFPNHKKSNSNVTVMPTA